jgi:hypothetical protein
MDFILNKNDFGLSFGEDMFYWELNGDDEVTQKDVMEAIKNNAEFDKLTIATYDDEPVVVELDNGTWDVDVNITVLNKATITNSRKKRIDGKYFFHVGMYAMDRNEECDDYEYSGAVTELGKFVTVDTEQAAFDMIVGIFNSLLYQLENYCPDEEADEE